MYHQTIINQANPGTMESNTCSKSPKHAKFFTLWTDISGQFVFKCVILLTLHFFFFFFIQAFCTTVSLYHLIPDRVLLCD